METQVANYRAVCSLMTEVETLNALAEWWENILWKADPEDEDVKPIYLKQRAEMQGKTV